MALHHQLGQGAAALGLGRRAPEEARGQRPAPGDGRGRAPPRPAQAAAPGGRGPPDRRQAARRPQRQPEVVRDLPRPDQAPQRPEDLLARGPARRGDQVVPEARPGGERLAQGVGHRSLGRGVGGRRAQQRRVLAEVDGHPSAADAAGARADPDDLAPRRQLVEPRRRVVGQPARKHLRLPLGGRQGQPLEPGEHVAQGVRAARGARPVDPLPVGQEAPERARVGRLDLAPQRRQARPAQAAHHLGVAPLPPGPAGPQLAAHHRPVGLEGRQGAARRPAARARSGRRGRPNGTARGCGRSAPRASAARRAPARGTRRARRWAA